MWSRVFLFSIILVLPRKFRAESIIADINAAKYIEAVKNATGKDVSRGPKGKNVPTQKQDIEAHMQFDYKQAVEVSQEEAINYILDKNKYHLISFYRIAVFKAWHCKAFF